MAMQIRVADNGGGVILQVRGEVDLYSSPELRAAIINAMKGDGDIGLDLSGVAYMDSSGVATLVEGFKAASDKQRSFVLVAPSKSVIKILQLARLDSVFEIRDSL